MENFEQKYESALLHANNVKLCTLTSSMLTFMENSFHKTCSVDTKGNLFGGGGLFYYTNIYICQIIRLGLGNTWSWPNHGTIQRSARWDW
jgi:hypothetical protein